MQYQTFNLCSKCCRNNRKQKFENVLFFLYKPEYSIIELAADEISLDPSSNIRRLFMKPGGSEPGPDGDGKCRPDGPIPGDGARRGGVARPKPESVSGQ